MYLLLTVLAVQQPAPPLASPVSDTAHVVIVATTDVHGRVLGWDYVRDAAAPGGLSRAATMVETLRAQYPEQVVLVDAGDLIEGNLFAAYFAERDSQRPHPVVDALNAMQYDAATPGNHEFDFGPAVLARATGDATYHYVSANVFRGASDTLVYPPYVVVTRAGVKIGITGLTTPGVMVWDRSELGGRIRVGRSRRPHRSPCVASIWRAPISRSFSFIAASTSRPPMTRRVSAPKTPRLGSRASRSPLPDRTS